MNENKIGRIAVKLSLYLDLQSVVVTPYLPYISILPIRQLKHMNFSFLLKNALALSIAMLFSINPIFSQESRTCAAMDHLEDMMEKDPTMKERRIQIEQDIQDYINNPLREEDGDVVIIPIVFHIIHNGDAIGSNENIAEIYIQAQLDQLNDDFRRTNSDADGTWAQAADTEVEFCLAEVDPNGNATTGIIRHNISGGPWGPNNFDNTVKPQTVWDRDNYLNFWSADLSGGLLGYAQFPGGPANTDGVVCLYSSVGSIDTPNPQGGVFDLGRTGTHEVGHWLNCFHIWGDDGTSCNGSDNCADTPNQSTDTGGCPSGVQTDACSPTAPGYMYQNYMDYSNDACMNIFTEDQRMRMHAVLDGSRSSLKTASCGAADPVAPTADFSPDSGTQSVCGTSTSISFTDASTGVPTSWAWTFSGAAVSPTSSNAQNPTVTANASGNLVATLTVTNAIGNDTHSGTIVIDLLPTSDPACQVQPCLDFDGGPYNNFNYADACAIGGCPEIEEDFEVWENEAYILAGLKSGLSYTFEFCDGYSATTWDAVITLGEYDNGTGEAVPNSQIAWINGCSLTFTAPADGDYIMVLSGESNCGGNENQTDNGVPTFGCNTDCASQCGLLFTDSGGLDFNHPNQQDRTYVLCPDDPTCEVTEVAFTSFELEDTYDFLTAYDGDDATATLIGEYTGTNSPGTLTSTHSTGCLTFVFASDQAVTEAGWEADVTCIDDGSCADDCPDDYAGANALSGSENGTGGVNNNGDYETDGEIESTQLINGGAVDYDSGVSVELDSGFEVVAGAEVDVFIDGCNDGAGGNTLTGNDHTDRRVRNNGKSRTGIDKNPSETTHSKMKE